LEKRGLKYHRGRVGEALREEIETLVEGELADPRIGLVSVSSVMVADDGRSAQVWVFVDGDDEEALQDIIKGKIPLARGGTEESEGGDYNPILEIFQSTAARRSSPGPREKRMKH